MSEKEIKELKLEMEECQVAENLRDGLIMYLEYHILPGRFLTACLGNNLKDAMGYASVRSWDYIFAVMNFLLSYAPTFTWGSEEIVKEWIKHKGK